jgi:hypothetical protein
MRADICPHTCIEFLKTVKRFNVNRLACGIACSGQPIGPVPLSDSVATKEPQLGGVLKFSFELFKTETWFEICRQIDTHGHSGALEHTEPPCAPAAHACTLFVLGRKARLRLELKAAQWRIPILTIQSASATSTLCCFRICLPEQALCFRAESSRRQVQQCTAKALDFRQCGCCSPT